MPGNNLIFYGTSGPDGTGDGYSQPDTTKWLGKWRASQTLHDFQSTLTAAQATAKRHFVVDSTRAGDGVQAHQHKWLLIQTGPAALSAARIESFDNSTGAFKLDRPTTANAASGDDYAVFDVNNVWPDVTAVQSKAGDARYRCIFMRNQHGATITGVKYYFVPLMASGYDMNHIHQVTNAGPFIERSDDQTDILDNFGQRDPGAGTDNFTGSQGWLHPHGRSNDFGEDAFLPNNQGNAIWLRRRIPAGVALRRSVAMMIVASSTTTGSDPDPLSGAAIMPYDILSAVEASLEADRFVGQGGGARLTGTVTDPGTGDAIEATDAKFDVLVGDVGNIYTDDDPTAGYDVTDAAGRAFATYIAPLAVDPGETAIVRMTVGAGEEVGDPQPRVSLGASVTFGYDEDVDLDLPQSQRTFMEDPATGFLMGI